MDKDQRERLDRLVAEHEKIERLQAHIGQLRKQYEAMKDGPKKLAVGEKLLAVLDRAIGMAEREPPAQFVSMLLLDLLSVLDEVKQKMPESLPPEDKACWKEILLTERLVSNVALKILDKPEIAHLKDPQFSTLLLTMIEIGKRLPVISGLTNMEIGFAAVTNVSSFQDIKSILHRKKAEDGARLRWRKEQAKKEKDQSSYDQVGMLADKLWDEGDRSLDWQMARYISRMDGFKHLDERRIRRALEPYAVKHDRCSGFRGGKKPKE